MSKKVAVIASILKPVDDTRLYEKLGLSISQTYKYRVNIIGFETKKLPVHESIEFHAIFKHSRVSIRRLLAPWKFFAQLLKLKPNLVVVCSPELLIPSVFYKAFYPARLWYDLQENYLRNIRYQSVYAPLLKPMLIMAVRAMQGISRPFVEKYLLAEKCYARELAFVQGKYLVLENKYKSSLTNAGLPATDEVDQTEDQPDELDPDKINLVFSGTMSKENGIMETLELAAALHSSGHPVALTLVGHIPDKRVWKEISTRLDQGMHEYVRIVGGDSPVPHQTIMKILGMAHFGMVAIQPNPSTENCIPTRIYEYLGLGLPMLLQKHPPWESLVAPYNAAIVLDFTNFDPNAIWESMQTSTFYTSPPGPEVSWEQEAQKLNSLL